MARKVWLCAICLHLYFFVNNTFAVFIDELKSIHFEVHILQKPLPKDQELLPFIQMTTRFGQVYNCLLPQIEETEKKEKDTSNEKNMDVRELLKPMKSGNCLLKGKDWWTYEFCFGHYIKQFHIEDGKVIGQINTLGIFESDYDWNNDTDQKHLKLKYHSQIYSNGSKCDLTGQPRTSEVRFYCEEDASDYIFRVDEPGTCSYIITVHTSRICSHPHLKPVPSKKAVPISCHPVLTDQQYTKYLQKAVEEKELADKKRSHWLNSQHDRLQQMKTELLSQIQKGETSKKRSTDNPLDTTDSSKDDVNEPDLSDDELHPLFHNFLAEVNRLKLTMSPESFTHYKKSLESHFARSLTEAEGEFNPVKSQASMNKLFATIRMFARKLDAVEDEMHAATKAAILKATAEESSDENDQTDNVATDKTLTANSDSEQKPVHPKDEPDNTAPDDEKKPESIIDDDELHVRIRRLDRKPDASGKMYDMDSNQRKKLEQAVKEKLEKAGLDTGGRRIEVKIITAGVFDNEEGKDFRTLSDEETNQFQNMIMALLTDQQEAVQEMERHKKLEESYKFSWDTPVTNTEENTQE